MPTSPPASGPDQQPTPAPSDAPATPASGVPVAPAAGWQTSVATVPDAPPQVNRDDEGVGDLALVRDDAPTLERVAETPEAGDATPADVAAGAATPAVATPVAATPVESTVEAATSDTATSHTATSDTATSDMATSDTVSAGEASRPAPTPTDEPTAWTPKDAPHGDAAEPAPPIDEAFAPAAAPVLLTAPQPLAPPEAVLLDPILAGSVPAAPAEERPLDPTRTPPSLPRVGAATAPAMARDLDPTLERDAARRRADDAVRARRRAAVRVRRYGGLVVLAGVLFAALGTGAYLVTRADLVDQRLSVSAAADRFAGDDVSGPLTAWAQLQEVDREAVLAGQGRTFGELPADDPLRPAVMATSFQRPTLVAALTGFAVGLAFAGLGVVFMLVGAGLLALGRGMGESLDVATGSGRHAEPTLDALA